VNETVEPLNCSRDADERQHGMRTGNVSAVVCHVQECFGAFAGLPAMTP